MNLAGNPEQAFLLLFLTFLGISTSIRIWLALRQIQYVQAHKDIVPDAFAERISIDQNRKAADYASEKCTLEVAEILTSTIAVLALTVGGGLQFLSEIASVMFAPASIPNGITLFAVLALMLALIDLPFGLYRTFVIEERFGFNKMTFGAYVTDLIKQLLLSALLGLPLITLVLTLMGGRGNWWWLWTWLCWMAFNLVLLALYPTLIAPLFNKFVPLERQDLKERLEALLKNCGFKSRGLFVMDGSRRSSHGNAYFSGFGSAKRIVLFDTLIARLTPVEIEAVLAHELGHFARRHIAKRIILLAMGSLIMLSILGWLINQQWFFTAFGVADRSDAVALLLFFLTVPVLFFPFSPLAGYYSRRHEFEADQFATAHSEHGALTSALVKLYRDNASPLASDPLYSAFHDSHPPASARIARLQSS